MVSLQILAGKRILITGAARGLGRDFAQAAAEAGAVVVMADILADLVYKEAQALAKKRLESFIGDDGPQG